MTANRMRIVLTGLALLVLPDAAWAYMGPGIGIGAIGTALGVIGALLLGLVAVVWYPLKRLFRRVRGRDARQALTLRGTEPRQQP